MTIPVFTSYEFIAFIKDNGWSIVSTDFFDKYNRIIFAKDGKNITFQYKEKYFYPEVVQTCKIFEIIPPAEHIHEYYRHLKMDDEICYCEEGKKNGKTFRECHGRIG